MRKKKKMFHSEFLDENPGEREKFRAAYDAMADIVHHVRRLSVYLHGQLEEATFKTKENWHNTILFMMMDFIEALDGIYLLVKEGSARNCHQLLRTQLELYLQFCWMVSDRDKYKQRSIAYEFWKHVVNHEWHERLDPSTNKGKEFAREMEGDEFYCVFEMAAEKHDIPKERDKLLKMVMRPRYAGLFDEYQTKKLKHWYSFDNGPKDLRALAVKMKTVSLYDALYRNWSGTAHGQRAFDRFLSVDGETTYMVPIRAPYGLPQQVEYAGFIGNMFNKLVVDRLIGHARKVFIAEMKEVIKPKMDNLKRFHTMNDDD